jgi:hypothetical protein
MAVMSMQTHPQSTTAPFASSFLLLLMVAGVMDIDSGYHDHKIFHRIEVLFRAARPDIQLPVVSAADISVAEGIPGNTDTKDLPSYFCGGCPDGVLFPLQNTGRVNSRGFYFSHIETASFNTPHQNSDEEEPSVYPPDVA